MARPQYGTTPLWHAASSGRLEVARLLLERGGNVEGSLGGVPNGATPLLAATLAGHLELVRLLLDKGANKEASMHRVVSAARLSRS